MEKLLEMMPADKQNIVYTNRRSKETQYILDKILKAPEEIKVDKTKEAEAEQQAAAASAGDNNRRENKSHIHEPKLDPEALELCKKYNAFTGKAHTFLLTIGNLACDD